VPGSRAAVAGHELRILGARALAQIQYRAERIGAPGLTGLALLVGALALFLGANLPQRTAVSALRGELAAGHGAADTSAATLGHVQELMTRLPARSKAPELVAEILAQADAAGVELPRGQYEFIAARDGIAAHYRISLPVHATYPQLRQFVDGTLASMPAVSVEGLRIERKAVGEDTVDAEVRLALFVRSEES
jgi:hypothetical protein